MVRSLLLGSMTLLLVACGGSGGGGEEAAPEFGPVFVVTNLNDAGPGSLRNTILDAPDRAAVVFDTALPAGTIQLSAPIRLVRSVFIGGLTASLGRQTISGGGTTQIFLIESEMLGMSVPHVAINDLVLKDGDAFNGGALAGSFELVELNRVQVVGCEGSFGGAIYMSRGVLRADDCAFTACRANGGGAVQVMGGEARFDRTSFFFNEALTGSGGAVFVRNSLVLFDNCTLRENKALAVGGKGGAVYIESSGNAEAKAILRGSTVVANEADAGAGGLFVSQGAGTATAGLHLSVLADNVGTTTPDFGIIGGAVVSGRNNVVGVGNLSLIFNGPDGNQCGNFGPGALDPGLSTAAFDGLGRVYQVPSLGSVALNVTDVRGYGTPNQDQRGLPRPTDGGYDAGAIERQ